MKLYIATNYDYNDPFDSISNDNVGIGESPEEATSNYIDEHENGCKPNYVYTLDNQLFVKPSYTFVAT
jgi:hypothetical protein